MFKKISKVTLAVAVMLTALPTTFDVSAANEHLVKVKLDEYLGDKTSVPVTIAGTYKLLENGALLTSGKSYVVSVGTGKVVITENGTKIGEFSSFTVVPVEYNTSNVISIDGKKYLGNMLFTIEKSAYVQPINTLPLEDYLKGVVPKESIDSWGNPEKGGLEALKAQAVAARTFAMKFENQTMTDTQSHQVYGGYDWSINSTTAVSATEGKVLKYGDKLVESYFYSSNGGKVLSLKNSWDSANLPYLQQKDDPYDVRSQNAYVNWNFTLNKQQIDTASLDLNAPDTWWNTIKETTADASKITNIKTWMKSHPTDFSLPSSADIKIVSIPSVTFKTSFTNTERIDGTITISYFVKNTATNTYVLNADGTIKLFTTPYTKRAYDLRFMVGTSIMKSPYIKSVQDNGTLFTINGGGFGHGIGMSQYGAYQMAKEGFTYDQILSFYYPTSTLENINPVTVSNLSATNTNNLITFTYELSKPAAVSLAVNDTEVIPATQQDSGIQSVTWDASTYSDGSFPFKVFATDKEGNTAVNWGTVTINPRPPVISNVAAEIDSTGTTTFTYTTDVKASTTIRLSTYGKELGVIGTFSDKEAGTYRMTWKNGSATYGSYIATITVQDPRTLLTTEEKISFFLAPQLQSGERLHAVVPGNSIDAISKLYNVPRDLLVTRNHLTSDAIYVGQPMVIPVYVAPTPPPAPTPIVTPIYYTVKAGDTLWKISSTYKITTQYIQSKNNLKTNALKVGQVLIVGESKSTSQTPTPKPTTPVVTPTPPKTVVIPAVYYVVQKGDTLYKIAAKYNVSASLIQIKNKLVGTSLRVGQKLLIKDSQTTTVKTTSSSQTSTSSPSSTASYYSVKTGDTLWKISSTTGVSVQKLQTLNNLKSNTLSIGHVLRIR